LDKHNSPAVIVGVRRDEEPTRAKERYFSPRDKNMEWNVADNHRSCGTSFKTDYERARTSASIPCSTGRVEHLGIHRARKISDIPLYFATKRANATAVSVLSCTFPSVAGAHSPQIMKSFGIRTPRALRPRAGQESEDAFEKLRAMGT